MRSAVKRPDRSFTPTYWVVDETVNVVETPPFAVMVRVFVAVATDPMTPGVVCTTIWVPDASW